MDTEEQPNTDTQDIQTPPDGNEGNMPNDEHIHKLNSLAVVKVADTVVGDPFIEFLVDVKMKIDHQAATKEEAELYIQIIDHVQKLIKGAAMNSEAIQQDVQQAENETGKSMDNQAGSTEQSSQEAQSQDETNLDSNNMQELLNHIVESSPHLKSAHDELKAKGGQFSEKQLLALAHSKLKSSKSNEKKEIIEENEAGKVLSPTNKGVKARGKRHNFLTMTPEDREEYLNSIYKR